MIVALTDDEVAQMAVDARNEVVKKFGETRMRKLVRCDPILLNAIIVETYIAIRTKLEGKNP